MTVLGVLAAAVMPLAELTVQRERERELKRALWEIRDAIDAYKRAADGGAVARPPGASGYPPNLDAPGRRRAQCARRRPADVFPAPRAARPVRPARPARRPELGSAQLPVAAEPARGRGRCLRHPFALRACG